MTVESKFMNTNKDPNRAENPKLVSDITRSQCGLALQAEKIKHML